MSRPRVNSATACTCLDKILEYLWATNVANLSAEELRDEVLRIAGEHE